MDTQNLRNLPSLSHDLYATDHVKGHDTGHEDSGAEFSPPTLPLHVGYRSKAHTSAINTPDLKRTLPDASLSQQGETHELPPISSILLNESQTRRYHREIDNLQHVCMTIEL